MDAQGALGDILNSLMQNPEVMNTVLSLAKGMGEASPLQAEETPSPATTEKKEEKDGEAFQIPPELLSKLPQMMSALTGATGKKSSSEKAPTSNRKELLRALKPFLSEKRCSVIDGLLQLEGLYGVLDTFKSTPRPHHSESI